MRRNLLFAAGAFCFLCALGPLLFGILNTGVILLLCAGLYFAVQWLLYRRLHRFPGLRRAVFAANCFGIVCAGVLSFFMARQAFFQSPPPQGEITLIVLGGKVTGDQPSTVLRNRLETAAAYLLANPQARCVVAGGQGPDEDYPEAVVMAAYLERRGIARERILLEAASTNTRENLRFSGALIADKEIPVAIVSDSFHQLRASIYARAEGLQPYSLSSYTPWGLFPSYWIRDMFGVIAAWVETRIATQP